MDNQDLYFKKYTALAARRKLEQHGNSYDSTTTACFALILIAVAVSAAGFLFLILEPKNPSGIVANVAYIGAGALALLIVIAIIVRIMQKHSRKPLIREKKKLMEEYERAVRAVLKYNYGLIPVDDVQFRRGLLTEMADETGSLVIEAMSLDGREKINLTLKEVDGDALIFTKYGVPYRTRPKVNEVIYPESQPEVQSQPETQAVTRFNPETVQANAIPHQGSIQIS
jgi:hypothetical protein